MWRETVQNLLLFMIRHMCSLHSRCWVLCVMDRTTLCRYAFCNLTVIFLHWVLEFEPFLPERNGTVQIGVLYIYSRICGSDNDEACSPTMSSASEYKVARGRWLTSSGLFLLRLFWMFCFVTSSVEWTSHEGFRITKGWCNSYWGNSRWVLHHLMNNQSGSSEHSTSTDISPETDPSMSYEDALAALL